MDSCGRETVAVNLNCPSCYVAYRDRYFSAAMMAEQATVEVSCSKTFFSVNSVYSNNVLNAHIHL